MFKILLSVIIYMYYKLRKLCFVVYLIITILFTRHIRNTCYSMNNIIHRVKFVFFVYDTIILLKCIFCVVL